MSDYLNEHKAMRLVKQVSICNNSCKTLGLHQHGEFTIISNLRNIKGFNRIYDNNGNLIAIELKVSSIIDELYLDSFVRFDIKESNVSVFYSKTGIIVNTEFLNEIEEDIEIQIISNYNDTICPIIQVGDYINTDINSGLKVVDILNHDIGEIVYKCVHTHREFSVCVYVQHSDIVRR